MDASVSSSLPPLSVSVPEVIIAEQFAKKLLGDSEIENILRRLDRLTQDEARMMEAHILEVFHGLMNNTKVLMDGGRSALGDVEPLIGLLFVQAVRHQPSRFGTLSVCLTIA
jgi:hypothetical protein